MYIEACHIYAIKVRHNQNLLLIYFVNFVCHSYLSIENQTAFKYTYFVVQRIFVLICEEKNSGKKSLYLLVLFIKYWNACINHDICFVYFLLLSVIFKNNLINYQKFLKTVFNHTYFFFIMNLQRTERTIWIRY